MSDPQIADYRATFALPRPRTLSIERFAPNYTDANSNRTPKWSITTAEHSVAGAILAVGNFRRRAVGCRHSQAHARRRVPPNRAQVIAPQRIWAVLLQEVYINARSVEVVIDLPFWSLVTVFVFGFTRKFLRRLMNPTVAQYSIWGRCCTR